MNRLKLINIEIYVKKLIIMIIFLHIQIIIKFNIHFGRKAGLCTQGESKKPL